METMTKNMPKQAPPQHQNVQPGKENEMQPKPIYDDEQPGFGRLDGKVAIITGGDSGIGRAISIAFAKEGADVAIVYLNEHEDAKETANGVRKYGREPLLIAVDISDEENCKKVVQQTMNKFGHLDIVVNNAAVQYAQKELQGISGEQLEHTFRVNIFAQFYLSKYAIPHLKEGSSIICTSSINAFKGNQMLMDYSSTKGAIEGFIRSLAQAVGKKGIRVNAVAPGPVWTPLIPASFPDEKVDEFGKDTLIGRAAQPVEIAPCYVFLASKDGTFITGQTLHPNGGMIVNA